MAFQVFQTSGPHQPSADVFIPEVCIVLLKPEAMIYDTSMLSVHRKIYLEKKKEIFL